MTSVAAVDMDITCGCESRILVAVVIQLIFGEILKRLKRRPC